MKENRKMELTPYDEIFSTEESRQDAAREKVMEIPLSELYAFRDHPFKVQDDERMLDTAQSIREYGVLVPAIARPRKDGGYELISGHRRKRGCELLGLELETGDISEKILAVLELFSGFQPDYHMYEVGIRHWDGYWFGGNRIFGDTYPHYWSSITGNVYALYHELTGKAEYKTLAEANLRGSLSLFFPDGSASCAMVYPRTVNGRAANSYDPWANDQDWAAYFYLKKHD